FMPCQAPAGGPASISGYKVLAPIRQGNLTIFPVVAAQSYDTTEFLTLDEGLRSAEVVVSESGNVQPLMRRPRTPTPSQGAQVNQLVLVNHSKRPLILLAGEIVTGGKQDRVIGKDRIVPADSDPIEMSVFCVEPGRWTGRSAKFDSPAPAMVQPGVRAKTMADQDQAKVWAEVKSAQTAVKAQMSERTNRDLASTTSY